MQVEIVLDVMDIDLTDTRNPAPPRKLKGPMWNGHDVNTIHAKVSRIAQIQKEIDDLHLDKRSRNEFGRRHVQ